MNAVMIRHAAVKATVLFGLARGHLVRSRRARLRVFEDSAVLFYQLLCVTLGPDGAVRPRVPWNRTAV